MGNIANWQSRNQLRAAGAEDPKTKIELRGASRGHPGVPAICPPVMYLSPEDCITSFEGISIRLSNQVWLKEVHPLLSSRDQLETHHAHGMVLQPARVSGCSYH